MQKLIIQGGNKLGGEVKVHGAKNGAYGAKNCAAACLTFHARGAILKAVTFTTVGRIPRQYADADPCRAQNE